MNPIRILFVLLAVLAAAPLAAQPDSLSGEWYPSGLHRYAGPDYARMERSLGLVTALQGYTDGFVELGVSQGNFIKGEVGGGGFGCSAILEINPQQKLVGPKASAWANAAASCLGIGGGLNGIYYINSESAESEFVLRPEIGLSFLKVNLLYGYNFFHSAVPGVNQQTVTLSYYHTILPKKTGT